MGNLSSFAARYAEIRTPEPFADFAQVAAAARGQWQRILPGLGVEPHALSGKHCPCPGCGGTDRFRFSDQDGNGTFICSQGNGENRAGDGFMLLEHVHGWTRAQSFHAVRDAVGLSPVNRTQPALNTASLPWKNQDDAKKTPPMNLRKEHSKVMQIWNAAKPLKGSPAETWLKSRGIDTSAIPADTHLRFHPWLEQYRIDNATSPGATLPGATPPGATPGRGATPCRGATPDEPVFTKVHEGPAMVALITNVSGQVLGVHKTFIKPDGSGKADIPGNVRFLKKCANSLNGGAVRIFPSDNHGIVGIGEGIETVLAMHTIVRNKGSHLPVMAALNSALLAEWVPDLGYGNIAIIADHDPAGLKAAQSLLNRMRQFRPDAVTDILTPPTPGCDWNDVLLQKTASPVWKI